MHAAHIPSAKSLTAGVQGPLKAQWLRLPTLGKEVHGSNGSRQLYAVPDAREKKNRDKRVCYFRGGSGTGGLRKGCQNRGKWGGGGGIQIAIIRVIITVTAT